MQCPRCQAENRAGRHFCGECGLPLAVTCPTCGFLNEAGEKFCGGCGAAIAQGATSTSSSRTPESYTPKHLAERILNSRAALEGERKQVTVLFADLKGSMELLADRDPEEARKLLDPVLERMIEAVHHYEGTVNQVMGDGIMALFGAPLAHEDHAVRACYAALRMQESVKKYAEELRRSQGAVVKIRVGLNSGDVVVRAISSDLHMDYTAVGQTTHLAARMEQIADPGAIVITPATLALVEGYVEVESLGPVPVKGLADAVEVYEIMRAGAARTRLQAVARRGLTRFVGRDSDHEQLRRAQRLAGDGHGQIAAIVGEAGVGKSRLIYEFTHSHRLQGWLVLEAACVSYGKTTSYLPVIDLLKGYFKIRDSDDLPEIREKVTGKLLRLDPTLEPTLPPLLALLDMLVDDTAWGALDPRQRRQRTLDALIRLLLREAREQPLLLIFEDLQWIDSETQAVLDTLIESLGSARLLLLVNYRPEYQHAWGSRTAYSQVRLDALPAEGTGELLNVLLGDDPGLTPVKQLLVVRGNPFFLEEAVRTLVETKALVGTPGRYRLTQPIQAIQVPPTVQVMLSARIDRLPPEDKRVLQIASVVGRDVPWVLLQAIAELPEETLRRALTHLEAAEFLYETSLIPELEYTFKHPLTHEVAYGSLLQERRRALHARIVEAIEGLYPDRLVEHIERLGHHSLRGEVWDKALPYLAQAGARAAGRSANRQAVTWFEQALGILQHRSETRETREQAIDLRFELRRVLLALGEYESMRDHLSEAERVAAMIGDQRRLGWVFVYWTIYHLRRGDHEDALRYGRRGSTIGAALGDFGLQVVADAYLGIVHQALGEYGRASELLGKSATRLQGDLIRERFGQAALPAVFVRSRLAWCLAELGEFGQAMPPAEEAVRIAEAVDQPLNLVVACVGVGAVLLLQGQLDQAIVVLGRAVTLCRDWSIPSWFPTAASLLGHAYTLSGDSAAALPLLEQAIERAASMRLGYHDAFPLGWYSEALWIGGRAEAAIPVAKQALSLAREHRHRGQEGWTLRLLGDLASNQATPDARAAQERYRGAMALATELGMRPLVAHCHLGLGKLYRRTGKPEQAQEHLAAATAMYRDMGMTYWLEKATKDFEAL